MTDGYRGVSMNMNEYAYEIMQSLKDSNLINDLEELQIGQYLA